MFLIHSPQFPWLNSMALLLIMFPLGKIYIPSLLFTLQMAVKSYCISPIHHLAKTYTAYWVISAFFFRLKSLTDLFIAGCILLGKDFKVRRHFLKVTLIFSHTSDIQIYSTQEAHRKSSKWPLSIQDSQPLASQPFSFEGQNLFHYYYLGCLFMLLWRKNKTSNIFGFFYALKFKWKVYLSHIFPIKYWKHLVKSLKIPKSQLMSGSKSIPYT